MAELGAMRGCKGETETGRSIAAGAGIIVSAAVVGATLFSWAAVLLVSAGILP